jgi:hypothetical protein
MIRGHWKIEALHPIPDTTLPDDPSRRFAQIIRSLVWSCR